MLEADKAGIVHRNIKPKKIIIGKDRNRILDFKWVKLKGVSSIAENDEVLTPTEYNLRQNYPNPFNPSRSISYKLAGVSDVEMSVYILLGQRVVILVSQKQQAGSYQVKWDASGFAIGIYYYKIEAGDFQDVKKMILLK